MKCVKIAQRVTFPDACDLRRQKLRQDRMDATNFVLAENKLQIGVGTIPIDGTHALTRQSHLIWLDRHPKP